MHQRYSTNTLPSWPLSQPFRLLAHNGEINTLRGNVNRMRAREAILASPLFGDDLAKLLPIIQEDGSDSAMLDNAPRAARARRPLAAARDDDADPRGLGSAALPDQRDRRGFYEYHAAFMEPWDGPAAVAFTDGRSIGRHPRPNGPRPARRTRPGTASSCACLRVRRRLEFAPERILRARPRLQPGRTLLVDLEEHCVVLTRDQGLDRAPEAVPQPGARQPHRAAAASSKSSRFAEDPVRARRRQHAHGYTEEEVPNGPRADGARGRRRWLDGQRRGARGVSPRARSRSSRTSSSSSAQVHQPSIDPLRGRPRRR